MAPRLYARAMPLQEAFEKIAGRLLANYTLHGGLVVRPFEGAQVMQDGRVVMPVPDRPDARVPRLNGRKPCADAAPPRPRCRPPPGPESCQRGPRLPSWRAEHHPKLVQSRLLDNARELAHRTCVRGSLADHSMSGIARASVMASAAHSLEVCYELLRIEGRSESEIWAPVGTGSGRSSARTSLLASRPSRITSCGRSQSRRPCRVTAAQP
jgi:hypothetical protein